MGFINFSKIIPQLQNILPNDRDIKYLGIIWFDGNQAYIFKAKKSSDPSLERNIVVDYKGLVHIKNSGDFGKYTHIAAVRLSV